VFLFPLSPFYPVILGILDVPPFKTLLESELSFSIMPPPSFFPFFQRRPAFFFLCSPPPRCTCGVEPWTAYLLFLPCFRNKSLTSGINPENFRSFIVLPFPFSPAVPLVYVAFFSSLLRSLPNIPDERLRYPMFFHSFFRKGSDAAQVVPAPLNPPLLPTLSFNRHPLPPESSFYCPDSVAHSRLRT